MTSQAIRDKVLAWHGRGYGATDTARQLGLPLEEVRAIIREGDGRPKPPCKVEFIEPPLFEELTEIPDKNETLHTRRRACQQTTSLADVEGFRELPELSEYNRRGNHPLHGVRDAFRRHAVGIGA